MVLQCSIVTYCKAWNHQLAEEMQARLPVEMRTTVYQYLWATTNPSQLTVTQTISRLEMIPMVLRKFLTRRMSMTGSAGYEHAQERTNESAI
jgi:hypothetical protein